LVENVIPKHFPVLTSKLANWLMSCIASRLVNFNFDFEVPNKEVFTALISRAPATITKCLSSVQSLFLSLAWLMKYHR
jgi:uncharacterized membrane protein